MVRDAGALLRRAAAARVGGDREARPGAPAEPGVTSRTPLRAIQPSASGAPRWSVPAPTPTKSLGVRTGKVPARVNSANTSLSLAPRKLGPKLARRSVLTTTAGASCKDELRCKVRDAISFWEGNHNNVKNVSSKLCQYGSHAQSKVEGYFDADFAKSSEDVLKLQLELDIFKTILVVEKTSHVEVEKKMTDLLDELKSSRYAIEDLESDLVKAINESTELKKSNYRMLEKQRMQASLEKERDLNTRYQQDQESHSSVEQEKDEICRQAEAETVEVIKSLQQQLDASIKNELLTKENLEKLWLENNQLRSLQNELSKLLDEKQCCEAQVNIFKVKLEAAQALIAESVSIATEAQQIAEKEKAYAEKKDKEVKLLERSNEDLEITVCELENKVNIVREEAKHERMQREELELKLCSIRQQKLVVPSFGNASSSLGDEMVNLVDPIRRSQDIHNEQLDAQELSETEPEEPNQPNVEMEKSYSSDEDYMPEISEFEQTSTNEYLEQYNVSEQYELHGVVGVDSDQSQSEYRSEEQLPPPSVEPVVEVVEENELPPLAPVRPNDPMDYMRAPSDELKRLRSRNHYAGQRTATDRRFWSIEQQDLYTSIYSRARLADMKWIDWDYIDSVEHFAGVRNQCAHLGLEHIMGYCCNWDSELIRQFYSTVHISADKTWMTWMTGGRKITANKRAWEEKFGIPSGSRTEIHSQLFLNDDAKRVLYTGTEYTLGHVNGLSPLASIANKILRTTVYPRSGSSTHSWNVLYHTVEQQPFDIISLIFGEIDLLVSDHKRAKDPLLYAPYIMGMIITAFKYEGSRECLHHCYKPRPQCKPKLSRKSHQPHVVEAVQGRAVVAQPITHTDLFQVVENGLKPIRHTLASMEGRIGRVEEGASVLPAQRPSSSSSSRIPVPDCSLEPLSLRAATPAPAQDPRTTSFLSSEQPSVLHTGNPSVSPQPVHHVRPSPFGGFHWYDKKWLL